MRDVSFGPLVSVFLLFKFFLHILIMKLMFIDIIDIKNLWRLWLSYYEENGKCFYYYYLCFFIYTIELQKGYIEATMK